MILSRQSRSGRFAYPSRALEIVFRILCCIKDATTWQFIYSCGTLNCFLKPDGDDACERYNTNMSHDLFSELSSKKSVNYNEHNEQVHEICNLKEIF